MNLRPIALVALLVPCAVAYAQPVYKWTDANGHVHYGDRNDAPQPGATLNIQGRAMPADPSASKGTASTTVSATGPAPESSNLQRCLGLARAMADSTDKRPATVRSQSQELLSLCPDTAYECSTYTKQPERNTCQATRMQPGGSILRNQVSN